jgi:hypothetical protein
MRNSTNTIAMKILMRRSGLQTKNRIKLCEKVYSTTSLVPHGAEVSNLIGRDKP